MTESVALEKREITYDDGTTRAFIVASVSWGLIGMLVGLLAALQLSFWQLNFETPWLTFGRIRPLHTNAVIFALVGNMMFAGIYYSTQRLLKVRMASDGLSKFHLYSWNLLILGAVLTLPFGITQSKEYAELEWFLDILAAVSWLSLCVNFFWTLKIRNERNLYVALWFYIATLVTITVLYVVNNLALPLLGNDWTKSYSLWGGAQDAMTQWWYGHNAVAFFLTTPILGIMYYFLPKAAGRPVYSYRLSIIHFWALVFIYIWAGPHHLLYTALPDWTQSLGMVFSLMLWAPSWGGMLNGLLTLRGAWNKVRTDPVLKFFVCGVTFYGMSTFEGPLLSIKSVSALGHYTDWIIGHVHGGALGWNGMMAAGMFYYLVPKLFGTKLWSKQLADFHFWIGTFGILMYVVSMWVAGVTQGLMWREMTDDNLLRWTSWVEVIDKVQPMYFARSAGGLFYVTGWVLMIVNLVMTAKSGQKVDGKVQVTVLHKPGAGGQSDSRIIFGWPTALTVVGLLALFMMGDSTNPVLAFVGTVVLLLVVVVSGFMLYAAAKNKYQWHDEAESKPLAFTVLTTLAIVVGGAVELVPGIVIDKEVPKQAALVSADNPEGYVVAPYTPLQLEGRDIYVSEGCYVCHSQMVRPFVDEYPRYGQPSKIEESMWDHPFQWGSKRTGPDLARLGNDWKNGGQPKYLNDWHYNHMMDPRSTSPGSIMPAYPWLKDDKVDLADTPGKLQAMQALGVPYTDDQVTNAAESYRREADQVVATLAAKEVEIDWDSEMVALIAYLQRLGRNQLFDEVASTGK